MSIEITRINRDSNGNSRMVVHFLNFITRKELDKKGDEWISISEKYAIALKRANALGGRKFHNRQYGGGIVFQCSSENEILKIIKTAIDKAEAKEG